VYGKRGADAGFSWNEKARAYDEGIIDHRCRNDSQPDETPLQAL